MKNGLEITMNGAWFLVETNTSAQNANEGTTRYDRGYFYRRDGLAEEEKQKILE